jgi:energy-converting hydrogenase B subunit D
MTLIAGALLLMVSLCAGGVALTRDPLRQTIVFGALGVSLTLLFFVLRAPDVALSELAVGTVLIPLIAFIAIVKTTGKHE